MIRHYTSRAGDPHRHLHLQINARVYAAGTWRGLHSVGIRDSIEAINGIGHAAVATDPQFRAVLASYGFTLNPETGDITQLAPYVGAFSARAAQIHRNIDRYEAHWRSEHPGEEPGPQLRTRWSRRAWAEARPDKVVPTDGAELIARWNEELRDLGYRDPTIPVGLTRVSIGQIDRDAAADWIISQLGAQRSAWNTADIRGKVEILLARLDVIAAPAVRLELAEDLTDRTLGRCTRLLARTDVPEHIRHLTSPQVLEVETDILNRLAHRGQHPARSIRFRDQRPSGPVSRLDPTQIRVAAALAGDGPLLVVEGAAGAGKTTTLRATQTLLARRGHRLMVVTPTLKAAEVAAAETGADGHSAAWLIHPHGWRWDNSGHWTRQSDPPSTINARLRPGDLLVVDEAGMLDQDTARALLTIADETGSRLALVGDRHQLPAVGRGGVLDHATTWAHPTAVLDLHRVRRFADPTYAALSLKMRAGEDPGEVFDALLRRGQVVLHASEVERTQALADIAATASAITNTRVLAHSREQVAALNAAIRDRRHTGPAGRLDTVTTDRGEQIGLGDTVATRRNDPNLGVANRQTWTVAGIGDDGSVVLHRPGRDRAVPASYASRYLELAYASTVHGVQGETVDEAHAAISEATGAATAYVAMTRGRHTNVAHLVAQNRDEARKQWVDVFNRGQADLGPRHARGLAVDAVDRYGPNAPRRRSNGPALSSQRPPTPGPSQHSLGL